MRSKWDTPLRVVEDEVKILWDFQMQVNKLVLANQMRGRLL